MKLCLSAPGKTYLVGEYAVLAGGPALVLNTSPRFELRVTRGETSVVGIPDGAPAAAWLRARRPLLEGYRLEFVDPFAGAGGLGASGAQFLLSHAFTTRLQHSFAKTLEEVNLEDVWNDYQVLTRGSGSGADLLAQAVGGVAEIDMGPRSARKLAWPYPELGWTLVRTHQKVATHEHLDALDRQSLSLVVRPARECVESYGEAPPEVFVSKLRQFTEALVTLNLRASTTGNLVERINAEPWCLFAKGCGALGADVVAVIHPVEDRGRARAFLTKQSLTVLATDADLTHGLEVLWT